MLDARAVLRRQRAAWPMPLAHSEGGARTWGGGARARAVAPGVLSTPCGGVGGRCAPGKQSHGRAGCGAGVACALGRTVTQLMERLPIGELVMKLMNSGRSMLDTTGPSPPPPPELNTCCPLHPNCQNTAAQQHHPRPEPPLPRFLQNIWTLDVDLVDHCSVILRVFAIAAPLVRKVQRGPTQERKGPQAGASGSMGCMGNHSSTRLRLGVTQSSKYQTEAQGSTNAQGMCGVSRTPIRYNTRLWASPNAKVVNERTRGEPKPVPVQHE